MAEEIFNSNAEELRKIINENIWFGQENKEVALEFLDACIKNYNDKVEKLLEDREDNDVREDLVSGKTVRIDKNYAEEETIDDEDWFDPEAMLETVDIGVGEFSYDPSNLNLKFQIALEEFIENFKNKK